MNDNMLLELLNVTVDGHDEIAGANMGMAKAVADRKLEALFGREETGTFPVFKGRYL